MSRDCNTISRAEISKKVFAKRTAMARALILWFAQDQVAWRRRQREGKLPHAVLHIHRKNEVLAFFPRADPFVPRREQNPSMSFGIAAVEDYIHKQEELHQSKTLESELKIFEKFRESQV